MSIIIDGTGHGTRAAVGEDNRLKVNAISEDAYVHAAEEGEAFNLNSEALAISGTGPFTKDLMYVKNNESSDIEVVGWFVGELNNRTGGDTAAPILFEMFGNPTGVAAGTDVEIVNRRIGDPRLFSIDVKSLPTGLTAPSSAALLYQYHYSGRAFGTINFTIPRGASLLLRGSFACNSCTLYTGFAGYVRGD